MMPKLSVSVPDELWERAQVAEPQLGPSQLVQTALQRLVARADHRPSFARSRPADSNDLVQRAKQRLAHTARERYEHGYRTGAEFAGSLPWPFFERLNSYSWEVDRWVDNWHENADSTPEEYAWYELVKDTVPEDYRRESLFHRGFVDALDDVWAAVTSDGELELATDTLIDPDDLPFVDPDDVPFA